MRPSWDQYYMEMAEVIKKRSTCQRRQVGAVIVNNKRILTSGYNGVPTGIKHCQEAGCLRDELGVPSGERHELCRGLHAEQNAIIQAALHGVNIKESTIYVTHKPCIICTKMIINAGIKEIIFKGDYPDSLSEEMLQEAGIIVEKYTEDKSTRME
ncbi:MAG: cytidine/deoxycytidylate deaminase family protein [Clostridiaceae bacterium]|nr:cytidine/deoxycytidylate deaminase family protein [Clostridiaceae bacterium]